MVKKSVLIVGLLVTYFGLIFIAGEYGQLVHPTTASLTVNGTPQQYGTELFLAIAILITLLGLFISYVGIFNPPWVKEKLNKFANQPAHGSNGFNQQSQSLRRFENQHHLPDYSDVSYNNRPGSMQAVDESSTTYSNANSQSFDSSPEPGFESEPQFQKKIEINPVSQNPQEQSVDSLLGSLQPVDEDSTSNSNDYSESFDSSPEFSDDYSESSDSSPQASISDKTCPFCGAILTNPNDPFCNNCGKRLN